MPRTSCHEHALLSGLSPLVGIIGNEGAGGAIAMLGQHAIPAR